MELSASNLKENFQLCEYCCYRNNSTLLIYIKARRIQEKNNISLFLKRFERSKLLCVHASVR